MARRRQEQLEQLKANLADPRLRAALCQVLRTEVRPHPHALSLLLLDILYEELSRLAETTLAQNSLYLFEIALLN